MSLKGLFNEIGVTKTVANQTADEIGNDVESARYHLADIVDEKRFVPRIDYSSPENFAKYGSAEKYYADSYTYVYSSYPYDGSLYEQLAWRNSGSYLDTYIFDNKYPRTNGYILMSYGGWGTAATLPAAGNNYYGLPAIADLEYIALQGGPGVGGGPHAQSANIWDPSNNRRSNLELDMSMGTTVEFWLKKQAFDTAKTGKEVVFDLWNNELSSSANYGRLRIELTGGAHVGPAWLVTAMSGTTGAQWQRVGTTTPAGVADNKWHHYAFSFLSASAGLITKYYVDGKLNTSSSLGSTGLDTIDGAMEAYIGALRTTVSGNAYFGLDMTGSGKLTASIDEFRYWKDQRSSKDIGRYWFTQVGGGTNTDLANTSLGVYYKFNEGITGVTSTDATVLDYSGRVTNGTWAGYTSGARSTGSAIVESSASFKEFKDPIIYSFHPTVESTLTNLKLSGSVHDNDNPSLLLGYFPSWIQEEDSDQGNVLAKLTQILASYFDTLYLQIESINRLQDIQYVSGSTKANTLAGRLLDNRGLLAPELFLDADVLEQLADRSEERLFKKPLSEIKNSIYQNIYNNLSSILKTKGTKQSFRNLLRCFGVDDEIYRLNVYANNIEYEVRNNRDLDSIKKRYIDFNNLNRFEGTVFQQTSSANTVGWITGSTELTGGYATTLEAYIYFPQKPEVYDSGYSGSVFPHLSSSLFGQHNTINDPAADPANTTWGSKDLGNFQVYAVRDEKLSQDARFVLTSSLVGSFPVLSSSYYDDVYTNTNWVFAVTVKPQKYPLSTELAGIGGPDPGDVLYTVEFKGTNVEAGNELNSFIVTGTLDPAQVTYGFMTGSRRIYMGAHRTNFTGSTLTYTDVRAGFCRYWLDDITLEDMSLHGMDIQNYGTKHPSFSPYLHQTGINSQNIEFREPDTLALNWDFETVSSSNAGGQFSVPDFSSGSTAIQSSRYGFLGKILGASHSGRGYGFPASSKQVVDANYVLAAELQPFELINSHDMISVLSVADDIQFTRESRPINFKFAIEKSMYRNISENMIKVFSVISDFNNIIGDPVNKYRNTYKELRILRNRFFEKVGNVPDLDRYIEFYKWFDSSLSALLQQLMPATADFSKDIKTLVESHMLERNKYQHRFPTIDLYPADFTALITSPLPLSPGWQFTHHPPNDQENTNANWWKSLAARDKGKLATGVTGVDSDREKVFKRTTYGDRERRKHHIYRFGISLAAGGMAVGQRQPIVQPAGTNFHPSKQVNYVFKATQPYGPTLVASNIPRNIMLAFSEGVEQAQDIKDIINPNAKPRLSFGISPTLNKKDLEPYQEYDGNMVAPFSLYSSSVDTGYNTEVVENFMSGVLITNLHEDLVQSNATRPLQGPFTEKFVGGRQYRHVPLNSGLDGRTNRPEGFRIELGQLDMSTGITSPGALAIVPPNYPFGGSPPASAPKGFLKDLPIANRLRNVGTKRPVNIGNILMTTASAGIRIPGTLAHGLIGNYSKNYQVVQTAGRTINDPFFQNQSFDFASYPQSPYPRLQNIRVKNTKAISIDDSTNYYSFTAITDMNTNKKETWSCWLNCTNTGQLNYVLLDTSDRYFVINADNTFSFAAYWTGVDGIWQTDDPITTGNEWVHVAITYDGNSTTNHPVIYVGGQRVGISRTSLEPTGVFEDYDGIIGIGYAGSHAFEGYVSDMAFYNTNLTADEIADIYGNSTLDLANYGPLRVASNLIFWWRMGDGPGDTVGTIIDQMGNANLTAQNSPSIVDISSAACLRAQSARGPLSSRIRKGFALPNRDGVNSNQSILVNKFSAPGGYETLSRGYLDPAHEEKSVYNVLPYRNLGVLNYGLSGSASADPTVANSIVVVDQIDKNRGLRQRLNLHCGPYGSDAAYGSVPADTYVTVPSYHKVYRNRKRRIVEGNSYVTSSVYDNWYVHHPIPRSEQQYSWITASMAPGESIFGYSTLSGGVFVESLPLITSSTDFASFFHISLGKRYWGSPKDNTGWGVTIKQPTYVDFLGLNTIVYEPISSSTNTLGYPSGIPAASGTVDGSSVRREPPVLSYINTAFNDGGVMGGSYGAYFGQVQGLNSILINRNGPYGWPTWKQIKTGDHPVRRYQRARSTISVRTKTAYDERILAEKGNTLKQFVEPFVYSEEKPLVHRMRLTPSDGPTALDLALKNSYGNKIVNYANYELDNLLETNKDYDSSDLYFNRINSMIFDGTNNDPTFDGLLSNINATYTQRVYPAAYNAFLERTRSRPNYMISNIWHDRRADRNETGLTNSQGVTNIAASVWPLDGHLDYSLTASRTGYDGAGELQNNYFKYRSAYLANVGGSFISGAAMYAARLPLGLLPSLGIDTFGGDQFYEVATQAGKKPYQTYESYSSLMKRVGKDYSVVPEFRVSLHMKDFVDEEGGDFTTLTDITDLFDLTGSAYAPGTTLPPDSAFFREYTNSDFMKFFDVVNPAYDGAQLIDGSRIEQSRVALRCNALLKFLPYKGFYPAERTLELATLFSQSYAPSMARNIFMIRSGDAKESREFLLSYRAIAEAMYSPGILHNTIKSGIAVSNVILQNTSSRPGVAAYADIYAMATSMGTHEAAIPATTAPEGAIYYPSAFVPLSAPSRVDMRGWYYEQLPFEALYKPRQYLTKKNIYDIAVHPSATFFEDNVRAGAHVMWDGQGSRLYELAIDNFMCETVDFFQQGLTTFVSKPENQFASVTSGSSYTMTVTLQRPMHSLYSSSIEQITPANYKSGSFLVDYNKFDMYKRISAFGQPIGQKKYLGVGGSYDQVYFSHLTPSYFVGSGSATFTFTAQYSGRPSLEEIFANTTISYNRMQNVAVGATDGLLNLPLQLSNSFNLMEVASTVTPGTTAEAQQWVIQSKFETPVINLAAATASVKPPANSAPNWCTTGITSANALDGDGLWHQYGSAPKGLADTVITTITGPQRLSLTDVVGLDTGIPQALGALKRNKQIYEAVVAVPFIVASDGRRKFYKLQGASDDVIQTLKGQLEKYVFPPRFDFIINKEMDPIAMYVFEFSAALTQKDLADIWQNLPPSLNETFVAEESIIEHKLLADQLLNRTCRPITEDLRWLVFKVKQRAQKDYSRYVKRGLVADLSTIPSNINNAAYSYNWPYDYFSLIELVKLDEAIVYESELPPGNTTQIVGDVNVVIPDGLSVDVVDNTTGGGSSTPPIEAPELG